MIRLNADIRKGFALLLELVRRVTDELVRKRYLGAAKSVNFNFSVVDGKLQAFKTEHRYFEHDFNPLD